MSVNKYANLPDIDTAPDIYETEDVFPSSQADQGDFSDEEYGARIRSAARGKNSGLAGPDELDNSNLIDAEEASKKFKKAERRRHRDRSFYKYPASRSPSPTPTHPPSLSLRLQLLQTELSSLEHELSDPSNPLLQKDHEEAQVEPGDLLKGLVDAKSRIEKLTAAREARVRIVREAINDKVKKERGDREESKVAEGSAKPLPDAQAKEPEKPTGTVKDISEMDRRLGELENLLGSASASLDEASPMPTPILPLLTRLNTQLTVLTQPRHLDNISRRLKLLLTDLDRLSSNAQSRRQPSAHAETGGTAAGSTPIASSALQEQLAPILTRLMPNLPHIPHILTRLRTLSALHTSAAEFQTSLESLEEDQKKVQSALEELSRAVSGVESSLEENGKVVKSNVDSLEARMDALSQRLEQLGSSS